MASFPGPKKVAEQGGISGVEMRLLINNMDEFIAITGYRGVQLIAEAGVDILSTALPRTPWDSGALRRSGRVTLDVGNKRLELARGSKVGTVKRTRGLKRLSPRRVGRWLKRNSTALAIVSFNRLSADGRDIALWTHEVINPFESRPNPPAATKPGTGPKYLESAFNERTPFWQGQALGLETRIKADIAQASQEQVIGPSKAGELWAVKPIRLIANRIRRFFRRR